jgi:hypothetical protein
MRSGIRDQNKDGGRDELTKTNTMATLNEVGDEFAAIWPGLIVVR